MPGPKMHKRMYEWAYAKFIINKILYWANSLAQMLHKSGPESLKCRLFKNYDIQNVLHKIFATDINKIKSYT